MPNDDTVPPSVVAGVDMWERPDVVARFADRAPDHRLQALFADSGAYANLRLAWAAPSAPKVLDLGCAAGRNTVWLARQGADVWALDASSAMVAETRRRLSEELGSEQAARRVGRGEMRDLHAYQDRTFDLVLALGVLQEAHDGDEWNASLMEIARVLRDGGLCLVANFDPRSRPSGTPLTPVEGERNVWLGFDPEGRRMSLPGLEELDADFAGHGILPALPTERVRVETARGFRFTLNALYQRTTA